MKKFIITAIAGVIVTSNVLAQSSISAIQDDLFSRAESYCSDNFANKKSPEFRKCVDEAYNRGWNRFKERIALEQEQARIDAYNRQQEQAALLAQQERKRQNERDGWALLGLAAQLGKPVHTGVVTCNTTAPTALNLQTKCF